MIALSHPYRPGKRFHVSGSREPMGVTLMFFLYSVNTIDY